jgi:hypothetical protein
MSDFINFFKHGTVGNTNIATVFTKDVPAGFTKIGFPPLPPLPKIPPPPKIEINPDVAKFFTTPPPPVKPVKIDSATINFFTKGEIAPSVIATNDRITKTLAPTSEATLNFLNDKVKPVAINVAQKVGGTVENVFNAVTSVSERLMKFSGVADKLVDSLSSPFLIPVLVGVGAIVLVVVVNKKIK